MAYTTINYYEFAPYRTERIAGRGIKKIVWDKKVTQKEMESFASHFSDERTKVYLQTTVCMPFDVYVVPATEARSWGDYIRSQKNLRQIFNCVYLLFGHDFIYVGKSVNGDPILGQVVDEAKNGFDYQMLFVPNNENVATMTNWTSDFMAYLETLMIERVMEGNPYCKNAIPGKSNTKSKRDLNMNKDKEDFAENVVDLMFEAFRDITYAGYLVPNVDQEVFATPESDCSTAEGADEGMTAFWKKVLRLAGPHSMFAKLVKPQKGNAVYRNMNADKLIASSSLQCVANQSTCRVELVGWGNRNSAETNLEIFDTLKQHREEIETEFGCQLTWDRRDGKFTTNISLSKSLSYADDSIGNIRDIADFFAEYFEKFYTILPKYCNIKELEMECYDIDR